MRNEPLLTDVLIRAVLRSRPARPIRTDAPATDRKSVRSRSPDACDSRLRRSTLPVDSPRPRWQVSNRKPASA